MYSMRERFLSNTQWLYRYDNIIFSHAGLSVNFIDNAKIYLSPEVDNYSLENIVDSINTIEPCTLFGFTPDVKGYDYYGTSKTQPLTWIRPTTLVEYAIPGYVQVVGHTPTKRILNIGSIMSTIEHKYEDLWLCDCLDKEQYLVIDNNVFTPQTLQK